MSFLNSGKASVLVTGGSSGIGLELARSFISRGHEVITMSRNPEKLEKAKEACPGLVTFTGTVATEDGRQSLYQTVITQYPQVNVLINNAGVNLYPNPLAESTEEDYQKYLELINTNLIGQMHMSALFLPHLQTKENSLIANNSSIQAFHPVVSTPVYAVTKAGIHAYTMCLRQQVKGSVVSVVEIFPPTVNTNMPPPDERGGGIAPNIFAEHVVTEILNGKEEITYESEHSVRFSDPASLAKSFEQFNEKA